MPRTLSKAQLCDAVGKSLREFGYPDATNDKIEAILDAWLAGKREGDLPHGIIGRFAEKQFEELSEAGADLSKLAP